MLPGPIQMLVTVQSESTCTDAESVSTESSSTGALTTSSTSKAILLLADILEPNKSTGLTLKSLAGCTGGHYEASTCTRYGSIFQKNLQ